MRAHAASELVRAPSEGRLFEQVVRPGFADCAPSGRIRLDTIARWLQDVAYADVEQAGVAGAAVWVVRRTRIQVARFPRFGGQFALTTFCSGMGRMWAERRTTISRLGERDADVEAAALWVHLDPETWRPIPFGQQEIDVYGPSAAGRRVTARLRHRPPSEEPGDGSSWTFRATELDIAGHINNAAYWQPLEEELLGNGYDPEAIDAEIEFRTPCQPGRKRVIRDGARRWIVAKDGEIHASVVLLHHPTE